MESQDFEFLSAELKDNQTFTTLKTFSRSLDILENDLNYAVEMYGSQKLITEEQIKLDTYLAYVNSTLFWMFLKLQESKMSKKHILQDLGRAKEMLAREKNIHDLKTAPRLNIAASKRFIAAGIQVRFVDMGDVMVKNEKHVK
ncbi:hypothetical protein KR222_010692 [Zaprionus bogoriensis]|nr:hypothetical protein KR222_010692 [Zaprionus bogoriensis]